MAGALAMGHPFFDATTFPWHHPDAVPAQQALLAAYPQFDSIDTLYRRCASGLPPLSMYVRPDTLWKTALEALTAARALRRLCEIVLADPIAATAHSAIGRMASAVAEPFETSSSTPSPSGVTSSPTLPSPAEPIVLTEERQRHAGFVGREGRAREATSRQRSIALISASIAITAVSIAWTVGSFQNSPPAALRAPELRPDAAASPGPPDVAVEATMKMTMDAPEAPRDAEPDAMPPKPATPRKPPTPDARPVPPDADLQQFTCRSIMPVTNMARSVTISARSYEEAERECQKGCGRGGDEGCRIDKGIN